MLRYISKNRKGDRQALKKNGKNAVYLLENADEYHKSHPLQRTLLKL
ncbi:hypothetical protein V3564_00100 [Bartonella sp. B12(2025)]